MSGVRAIARHAIAESVRRRVFLVVLILSGLYVALFLVACIALFSDGTFLGGGGVGTLDTRGVATATMLGLGMFAILFLGAVLAVFLTLGVVRGDAERGLLQPVVVRPVGRGALLLGRFVAAAAVSVLYVVVLYAATLAIVQLTGHRWPDRVLGPGLALCAGVLVVVWLSLLGSVFLSSTANGIAIFMAFGAGLVGGLMTTIGHALNSSPLMDIAHAITYALPFEALYQAGLHALTADQTGFTGALIQLGPFGSAQAGGAGLLAWVIGYVAVVALAAFRGFARRDL